MDRYDGKRAVMQSMREIKDIIKSELPRMMETDPEIREFIFKITRDLYAGKQETESRFDRILNELQRDREANERKWEENQKEIRSLIRSVEALSRKHDSSIGALGARWGLYRSKKRIL